MNKVKKFRKKPVEIEAIQFTKHNKDKLIEFLGLSKEDNLEELIISTLEGDLKASYGDYIIKGVKGEFYPCKPDIFKETYEEVEEEETIIESIEEPKIDFKPFDKVLVRDGDALRWRPRLFAWHNVDYKEDYPYPFETTDGCFRRYCIPYDENLANTTKNKDE